MDGDGCASKLVLDENGEVKNEYVDADGNVLVGDYDLVPLLDSFIKEHPDFSYHGRKGILAMTGYNGVWDTEQTVHIRPAKTFRMTRRNSWKIILISIMTRM